MAIYYGDKETMMARLEANIEAITGMQRVDRQHYEDFNNYAYPSAFINDIREDRTYILQDVVKVDWSVVVIAFDMSESENLDTKLNALTKLVKAKLHSDTTLNSKAYTLTIGGVDTDRGFMFPHCVAIFSLNIMYLEKGTG